MSFLKHKHQVPKVPTTSVIALQPSGYDNQVTLYFAVHTWINNITANKVKGMLYYVEQGKKFPIKYYFSPYTLNNFFTFMAKMIEGNTVIPQTHGKQFVGSNAKVIFYENIWEMNGKHVVKQNNKPCVVGRNVEASFPDVPLTDKYQHITVWANYYLFCSYTTSQIDSFKDLKGHYHSLYTTAKEITQQYQVEYKQNNGKSIPKSHLAVIPTYQQFVDRNHDSVYIPALATKQQKKIAHAPHQDYDTNIMYLRKHSNNKKTNQFKQDEINRHEVELDKRVNDKFNPKKRKLRIEERNRQYQAKIKLKKHIKEAKKRETLEKSKHSQSKNKKNNQKDKNKKDSNQHKTNASTKSKQAIKAKIKKNISVSSATSHDKPNKNKESKASNTSKSSSNNKSNVPVKTSTKSSKAKSVGAKRQLGNIDYSSIKEPYVMTTDMPTLTQVIKSFYALNHKKQIKFDSNNYFKVGNNALTNIKNPQKLLRNGKLGIEQYITVRENNYKRFANDLLKHEENTLNEALDRHEHNMTRASAYLLAQKIPAIFKQYKSDTSVKKSAFQYFKKMYGKLLKQLTIQYNQRKASIKHVEQLRMQTRIAQRIANLKTQTTNRKQQAQQSISDHTVIVYNNSRQKRNADIAKTLRNTKSSIQKALKENLGDHKTEVCYQAGKVGHMIFDMLYRRLQINRKAWRNTASKIVALQTKRERAKAKLHEVTVKEETTDAKGQHHQNKALQAEIQRLQSYTDKVDKRSDKLQKKLSNSQTKSLQRIDMNTRLQEQLDSLKEQKQEDAIKYKAELRNSQRKLKETQQAWTNHASTINKTNKFTQKENTQNIALQDKLAQTIGKLQNAQSIIKQYEDNSKLNDSNVSKPTSLSTKDMQSKIAYYKSKDAKQHHKYRIQRASQINSLASKKSNYASMANSTNQQSKAKSYSEQRDLIANKKQKLTKKSMPQTIASKKIKELRRQLKIAQKNHSATIQNLNTQRKKTSQAEYTARSNAKTLQSMRNKKMSNKDKSQPSSAMKIIGPDDMIATPSLGNQAGIQSLKNQDTITELRSQMNSLTNKKRYKKHILPWRL